MDEQKRQTLRTIVRGGYDLQKLRIQMGNRLVGNFKARLGQEPGEKEETLDADAKKILKDIRASYKKITDGVKTFPRQATFKGNTVISDYTELCLVSMYCDIDEREKQNKTRLENCLKEFPLWTGFLEDVRGCGPLMAGVIIGEIDIEKARYPSSLWKYAGLDVANGAGRSRKKEHLVEREYTDKDGKPATRMGITFNPFLKTKLVGVLASSFVKAGEGPYEQVYRGYKARLENHPDHIEKSKGHRNNMALRYMVKIFLIDLHREWRALEGLSVSVPYSEGKLGMPPHAA